jgi:PASTA domain
MNIEEQLREYKATLDAATAEAAGANLPHGVVPIRVRPARTLAIAAVAVAASIAIAFAAVGVAHHSSSTSPAGVTTTPTSASSPITAVATVTVPNVVGMRTDSAAVILSGLHLSYTVVNAACTGPSDVVNRQLPAAGTGVRPDQVVSLVLCNVGGPTTLTVVVCPTESGTSPSPSDPTAPSTVSIATPSFTSPELSGYSDGFGRFPVVAPKGWNCKALDATDGGVGVGVTPPGATPRDSWGVGGTVTLPPTDGVFAQADGACQGCTYGDVCTIVPSAAADFPDFASVAGMCHPAPAGEHVTPLGNNFYRIDDPAGALGPDAAHSVLRYDPKTATTDAADARVTCILPASESGVCDALLAQFRALNR